MTCQEVRAQAGGLAAMPPGDPERDTAYRHAADCPGCTRALGDSEALVDLVQRHGALPSPDEATLARIAAALETDIAASNASATAAASPAGSPPRPVAAGASLPRRPDPADRPVPLLWLLPALALAFYLPTRMAGADGWLAMTVLLVALVGVLALSGRPLRMFAVALAGSTAAALLSSADVRVLAGAPCMAAELTGAAFALGSGVLWGLWNRGIPRRGAIVGATIAGAMAAEAGLALHCSHLGVAHALLWHVGGVALAASVAWLIHTAVMALRPARS